MHKLLVRSVFALSLVIPFAPKSNAVECDAPAREPVRLVDLPGRPFSTIPSPDGCWLFISVGSSSPQELNGIVVLRRVGNGDVRVIRVVPVESNPAGMIMTHDGKLLILADDEFVVFLDVQRIIASDSNPILGFLRTQRDAGSVYVNVTRNDDFLFVSDEGTTSVSVIDLKSARANGFNEKAIVGKIPVGEAPIALTFSTDENFLFTTSEVAPKDWNWPAKCKSEGEDPSTAKIDRPEGAIVVVDATKAQTDPVHSVVSRVHAGCSPVRLVRTRNDASVWVTMRNSDAVAAFDTAKLVSDPEHARIGSVPVGRSPVGLAFTHSDRYLAVANSSRFDSGAGSAQSLAVIDPRRIAEGPAAVVGSIETGSFPREFGVSPDGKTLFLANYVSKTLEIIDAEHLPVKNQRSGNAKQ